MGRDVAGTLLAGVVVVALVLGTMWGVSACDNAETETFTRACLAAHPAAHVRVVEKTAYKSYTVTRFCLGPNGEVWDVQ